MSIGVNKSRRVFLICCWSHARFAVPPVGALVAEGGCSARRGHESPAAIHVLVHPERHGHAELDARSG